MALRFYLADKQGTGARGDEYRPEHFDGLRYQCIDYGDEPYFLVASDVTNAQHTTLTSFADIAAFPQNLDLEVGGNLSTVQTELENRNLPGTWVNANHTFRQILFGVWAVMTLAGVLYARSLAKIFESGITLSTTMAELTQTQRNRLEDAAIALDLDYSSVTGSTTVRQVLRILCQQMKPRGSFFGEQLR